MHAHRRPGDDAGCQLAEEHSERVIASYVAAAGTQRGDSAGVLSLRACLTTAWRPSRRRSGLGDGSRFGFLRLTARS